MCYLITDIDESHLFDYLDNLFSDTEDKGATALLIIKCILTTNVSFSPTVDETLTVDGTSSGVENIKKPDSASSDECLKDNLGNYK